MRMGALYVPLPLLPQLRTGLERRRIPHDVFPPAALDEAQRLQIPVVELARRPLVLGISVDGSNPYEIDDAFSVRAVEGGYEVEVSIADPTALLLWDGPIDAEARRRGRSLYGPGETYIPMLPQALVDFASLTPGKPRLALTVWMRFGENGQRLETEIYETVFINHQAIDYSEAGEIAQHGGNEDPLVDESLRHGGILARLLRSNRRALLPQEFGPSDNGLPHGPVRPLRQGEALGNLIVEEFMIAANTAVAEFMHQKISALYRCHSLRNARMDRESIREQLQRLSEAGDIGAITGVISASFDVATYSLTNRGHAGLDLSCYTHATSPLRRYADMVNHRLLRILLRGGAIPGEAQKETEEILEAIAQKISVQPKEREKVFIGLTLGREVDAKGFLPPLSEARTANLPPARLAFLLQNCFDDPASMAFFRAYFSDYRENNQYVEILNQFCRLEGWAGPEYTEKEVKPARRSGRIRYTGQFSVVVDGVRRSSGVKPYPMVGKKSARNRAAFYLLKDYVMERLSGPAIKP